MWDLVCYIKGRTKTDGVEEQGIEKNVWQKRKKYRKDNGRGRRDCIMKIEK
jgi:hypothetical protein